MPEAEHRIVKVNNEMRQKQTLRKRQTQLMAQLTDEISHYRKHLKHQFKNILNVAELPFEGRVHGGMSGRRMHSGTDPEGVRHAKIRTLNG